MTQVIHKYPFDSRAIFAPPGRVLLVGYQGDSGLPTLWIDHNERSARIIEYNIVPTGGTPPDGATHVGSCVCDTYVWHVYRR